MCSKNVVKDENDTNNNDFECDIPQLMQICWYHVYKGYFLAFWCFFDFFFDIRYILRYYTIDCFTETNLCFPGNLIQNM